MSEHTGSARRTRMLIGLSRWPEALDEVQQALAINPYDSDLLSLLATVQYALADYEAALEAADRAIAAQWSRARSHSIRGLLLGKLLRFDEAEEALDVAMSLEPEDATHHITYAELLLDRTIDEPPLAADLASHFARTLRHANAAVRLTPESASAHRVLASAYIISNQSALAEKSARRSLTLEPNNAKSMHVLAVILESLGRTRDAGDVWVAAGQANPSSRVGARLAHLDSKQAPVALMTHEQWFWFVAITVSTMAGLAAGEAIAAVWGVAMLFLASCACIFISVRLFRHGKQHSEALSPEARRIVQKHQAMPGSITWDDVLESRK